ncbi:MAG TPA: alpha-glucan family phosphorylase [Pyrinomonadaceae bacterium]|nr:alpha-glucan family phosphorylase [Pyrinomonadaceae bacterium]
MSERTQSIQPKSDIDGFDSLVDLALNLRWSWSHGEDELWEPLDPELWELTHNPWLVLQTVSHARLKTLLLDPDFRQKVDRAADYQQKQSTTWFQQNHGQTSLGCVAYFSMEFMLSEALPIYSGGLGNVAGDQLKAASDLGVPVVGVGLLYQRGYFRQVLDADGGQHALYPYNDPGLLPIKPVRNEDGEWVRLKFELPGYSVWVRAWQAQVGHAILYLLDTNDPANPPFHRGITSELYGGGLETRWLQEIVLGICGWRLLRKIGYRPEVCHLNEGHAALAVLERARSFMTDTGASFEVALAATRAGNLFTTHTAVPAGFDRFPAELISKYMILYAKTINVSPADLLGLGRANPNDENEQFNMAYLALRGSGAANGVSRLHGEVSRDLFQSFFPRWPREEVPIGHVTNGVHVPSWDSPEADKLWAKVCGEDRWVGLPRSKATEHMRGVSDSELWRLRSDARAQLVQHARRRTGRALAAAGASAAEVDQAATILDENTLTLGFARRFATYKRPTLLLQDPERLVRLLTNPQRPVQLLIAGKAHPADEPGQALIRQWTAFISSRPEVRSHVVFLPDYDMLLTEQMVQGVDVWINNPRRPWEACGTSGMKVLVNGGINLSELDGWWAEAFEPGVGWAIQKQHIDAEESDAAEAEALYAKLEQEIIPLFYYRDNAGLPVGWISHVRESMARLTPQYSADRAVRDYTEKYYLPAAATYLQRAAENGALARRLLEWRDAVSQAWPNVRFGELRVESNNGEHSFRLQLHLGDLSPESVSAELYADALPGGAIERHQMIREGQPEPSNGGSYLYSVRVPATRPATDYTARVIPHNPEAMLPLEAPQILWQH